MLVTVFHPVDSERERLTSEQSRALARVNTAGVVALIGVIIAMNLLAREDIAIWRLVVIGGLVMAFVVTLGTVAVARIERRPVRDVVQRAASQWRVDMTKKINSVRRR